MTSKQESLPGLSSSSSSSSSATVPPPPPPVSTSSASSSSAENILEDVNGLRKKLQAAKTNVDKYLSYMSDAARARKQATEKYNDYKKELQSLTKKVKNVLSSSTKTKTFTKGCTDGATKYSSEQITELEQALQDSSTYVEEIDQIRANTGSIFVRLFLGQVNVKASTKEDKMTLREEYDKFKSRTNWGFIIFPLIWILTSVYLRHTWRYTHWIHILTHVWLLYYYVSLSLRENILKVNGSNIRPWWIYHHYVSSAMSIIVLTWPADSRSWDKFTIIFTSYFLYQGIVQFLQAAYQNRRHYALRALGKATEMDVKHTETLTEFHAGLYAIVVLVFITQAWQIYNGLSLLQVLFMELNVSQPWYEFREEVQCGVLGIMFIFLGITNFVVTVQTLLDKSTREREQRERLQRTKALTMVPSSTTNVLPNNGASTTNLNNVLQRQQTITELIEVLRDVLGTSSISIGGSFHFTSPSPPPHDDNSNSSSSSVRTVPPPYPTTTSSSEIIAYPTTQDQVTSVMWICAVRKVTVIPRGIGNANTLSSSPSILNMVNAVPGSSINNSSSSTVNNNNVSSTAATNNASSISIILDLSRLATVEKPQRIQQSTLTRSPDNLLIKANNNYGGGYGGSIDDNTGTPNASNNSMNYAGINSSSSNSLLLSPNSMYATVMDGGLIGTIPIGPVGVQRPVALRAMNNNNNGSNSNNDNSPIAPPSMNNSLSSSSRPVSIGKGLGNLGSSTNSGLSTTPTTGNSIHTSNSTNHNDGSTANSTGVRLDFNTVAVARKGIISSTDVSSSGTSNGSSVAVASVGGEKEDTNPELGKKLL